MPVTVPCVSVSVVSVKGAGMLDVGRMGATGLAFVFMVLVLGDGDGLGEREEVAGHSVAPHARSVGQQPPPRVAGQERKPGEQVKVDAGGGGGGGVVVVVVEEVVVERDGEAKTVGVTTSVEVEICAPTFRSVFD